MNGPTNDSWGCPLPATGGDTVSLAHGEGGRLMRRLLRECILPALRIDGGATLDDAATIAAQDGELAFTTDGFVVAPLFFPGGDIGQLAVFGTVNDLAVSGARPVAIGLALMIEEGLSIALLERVLRSAAKAAARARVAIVAGDTKVVPRGAVDKLFIAASGIGVRVPPSPVGPASLRPGDAILVTGPIGRHGIAVMNAREGLAIQPEPMSDCAPLTPLVEALRSAGVPVRAMRDATRGGVAAVLHEWAAACGHSLAVVEADVPVSPDVVGACELLGLDPLHVANEGTMVVAVCPEAADRALESLRSAPLACQAARIGQVQQRGLSPVVVQRALGRFQPLDEPAGAPLPRIC